MAKQPKNTGASSTIDLGSMLEMPVAGAPAVENPLNEPQPPVDTSAYLDDAAPQPQPQASSIADNSDNAGNYQQLPPTADPNFQDVPPSLSPDDAAIIGVNILDGIQQGGFAWLANIITLTKDQRELLDTLDKAANRAYEAGSKEAIAMAKWKQYVEYVKGLPFNEGEKHRLTTAAIIYMRTTNFTATPFGGLMAALSEVFIGRTANIFINKFNG